MGEHRPGRDHERDQEQRLTLAEAAEVLGLSKDGVRMRVRRGSLRSEKGEDGRRYVFVADQDADRNAPESQVQVEASRELVDALRSQVEDLQTRLDRETEANRENRRIIAGLIERVPALEPPEASETAAQEPERAEPHPAGAQETAQHDSGNLKAWTGDVEARPRPDTPGGAQEEARRPWWRRVFGS